jgi:hypothetical protein
MASSYGRRFSGFEEAFGRCAVDGPWQQISPVVGEAAGNPGTTKGERTMNDMKKITKNEEQPALHEVETAELQAIVGGHLVGNHEPPPPFGYGPWPVPTHLQ